MTLFISNADVQRALDDHRLDPQGIMDWIEEAYRDLADGNAAYSPRRGVATPVPPERRHSGFRDERFVFGTMEGVMPSRGYFAIRMKLDISYELGDPAAEAQTREKYCIAPGTYCGLILLVDAASAEPLALMNDGVVQHLRVAATNALAARYMGREDARVLGIYGSGGMAHSHAVMMSLVRDLDEVRVYSPTPAHREAFAQQLERELKLPVWALADPSQLPVGCDMLAACTDSTVPVIGRESIERRMFLTCVTSSEVDPGAADLINAVVLHQTIENGTVVTYWTGRDYVGPDGGMHPHRAPEIGRYGQGPMVRGTLAQLVSGRIPGRVEQDEINYFYNNIGSGLQFAAIAGKVYETLRGTAALNEIPTEWLTQTIRD